jgi:hypothetical protein
MALIVEYHVVADMYPVGATAITAGMLVELNAAGSVVPAATASSTFCIGIAGDSALAAEGQTTAYSDQVTLGADGANTRFTENRVSDFYDESLASNKMTVYNGGGKFWISSDLATAGQTPAINELMDVSATDGFWDNTGAAGTTVGICVGAVQAYPSGVPGTATTDGSMSLGNYFCVTLRI